LQASNASQTISQRFTLGVAAPPLAQVSSASSATFFAGAPNSFDVVTHGAETPVTIGLPCEMGTAVAPGWVSLDDHGDGTATLSGIPPAGTEGPFSFRLEVFTKGESAHGIFCDQPNFTINVSAEPRFLSPNRIQFGPPPSTGTTFSVVTNQASGLISLEGTLPAELSFQPDASHGSATIQGFPAVGTGGVYPLVLSMTNAAGTGFQNLGLLVKEAPTFGAARDSAVFYIGTDNSFSVPTTGFPKAPELIGNENPVQLAMHIDVSGALPPGVSFNDTNQLDIPTGTGLFTGIPDPGSEGVYPLTLTADNGVLPAATLDFTLYVAKAGDVNRDGITDKRDLDLLRMSLGKTPTDPDFDPLIDTNNDGIIDEQDFKFVKDACGDPDGDGACESYTEDRDHDGIPDAEDFDPTGYLYDVHTGEILSGGKVTVSPVPASMPHDGSGGFYQFLVDKGETVYTLTVQPPLGCRPACPHSDPPPLDPNGMSVVLGSSEVGNTGLLASAQCSDNPHALTLQLGETGDEVLLNNIALDCSPSQVPLLDPRGILLAILALMGIAALGFRRRRRPSDERLPRGAMR
jgi:MYXO-CTERM domain-containing protein